MFVQDFCVELHSLCALEFLHIWVKYHFLGEMEVSSPSKCPLVPVSCSEVDLIFLEVSDVGSFSGVIHEIGLPV